MMDACPHAVDERRDRVADLIGDQSLSARSVLATALLGADQPHLTVGELVAMASLFGISDGAARTCLWRMVANGELTSDDGTYALAGRLARTASTRRRGIPDRCVLGHGVALGSWRWSRWNAGRRPIGLRLRKAATALHLAELREGVWIRPDNLDPDRLPTLRAVLDLQCVHFHDAATDIPAATVRSLFSLDDWAADARRLTLAMRDEIDVEAVAAEDFAYQFGLSVTVVRHLQLDPLLPAELIPQEWPGHDLRSTYRRFNDVFKQRLNTAFR